MVAPHALFFSRQCCLICLMASPHIQPQSRNASGPAPHPFLCLLHSHGPPSRGWWLLHFSLNPFSLLDLQIQPGHLTLDDLPTRSFKTTLNPAKPKPEACVALPSVSPISMNGTSTPSNATVTCLQYLRGDFSLLPAHHQVLEDSPLRSHSNFSCLSTSSTLLLHHSS